MSNPKQSNLGIFYINNSMHILPTNLIPSHHPPQQRTGNRPKSYQPKQQGQDQRAKKKQAEQYTEHKLENQPFPIPIKPEMCKKNTNKSYSFLFR